MTRSFNFASAALAGLALLDCGARSSLETQRETHWFDEPGAEGASEAVTPSTTVPSTHVDPTHGVPQTDTPLPEVVLTPPRGSDPLPPALGSAPASNTSATPAAAPETPNPLNLPGVDWSVEWGSPIFDAITAMEIDPFGNVVVVGQSSIGLDQPGGEHRAHFVRKVSLVGELLWDTQTPDGGDIDILPQLALSADGDVFLAATRSEIPTQTQARVMAFDVDGREKWTAEWGELDAMAVYAVAADSAGAVYVAGSFRASRSNEDTFVTKLDSAGAVTWTRSWEGEPNERIVDLIVHATGEMTLAVAMGNRIGETDAVIIHTDAAGDELWRHSWTGGEDTQVDELAVDTVGNLFVAGTTGSVPASDTPDDSFVSLFTPAGELLWTYVHDEPLDDFLTALSVDSRGRPAFAADGAGAAIVQLDAGGSRQWSTPIDTALRVDVEELAFGMGDRLFLAGEATPRETDGGPTAPDVFIVALEPPQ